MTLRKLDDLTGSELRDHGTRERRERIAVANQVQVAELRDQLLHDAVNSVTRTAPDQYAFDFTDVRRWFTNTRHGP